MTPRYLRGYGLIELPLAECIVRLDGARTAGPSQLRVRQTKGRPGNPELFSRRAAIEYLNHLTFPATRWALFAVNGQWTAALTNRRDGSDFADDDSWVADACRARVCRVVDHDGEWRQVRGYKVRLAYPARIFALFEPERESFGQAARSIYAALDGDRWTFGAHGEKSLPIEATFRYDARLTRDRFTSENLRALLRSLGVEPSVPGAFQNADDFGLIDVKLSDKTWRREVEAKARTPAEADDPGLGFLEIGLDWVPHMKTHAESVVWNLKRAVLLNPSLQGDAEPHLRAARRRLGDEEFARLSAHVEERLRTQDIR